MLSHSPGAVVRPWPHSLLGPVPFFPSLIPCLYPTRPPATLWRRPTGFSSIWGPFCAPCTGRSLPVPFCLGGLFPSGPVTGPSSWPRPTFPRYPCPFLTWSPAFSSFFSRANRGPSSAPFAPTRSPAACSLCAFRLPAVLCGFVFFSFFGLPPPLPAVHSALWFPALASFVGLLFFYPPPCMHARQHCTDHRLTAPLSVPLRSHRPRVACPLAVPGHARWAPLLRVTLLSSLSSLPSPPCPVTRFSPSLLLLLFCSVCSPLLFPSPGLYLARSHAPLRLRTFLRHVGRLGRPPQVPLLGGFPHLPPPPASPPSVP